MKILNWWYVVAIMEVNAYNNFYCDSGCFAVFLLPLYPVFSQNSPGGWNKGGSQLVKWRYDVYMHRQTKTDTLKNPNHNQDIQIHVNAVTTTFKKC